MYDRIEPVVPGQIVEQFLIADIAFDKASLRCNRPPESGRQIVQDNHFLTGIGERVNHVAAYITSSSGYQNRHADAPPDAFNTNIPYLHDLTQIGAQCVGYPGRSKN